MHPSDHTFLSAPWRYVPSAMSLFEPHDPIARTGAVIAETARGELVCVIQRVDESVGRRVVAEHNAANSTTAT